MEQECENPWSKSFYRVISGLQWSELNTPEHRCLLYIAQFLLYERRGEADPFSMENKGGHDL